MTTRASTNTPSTSEAQLSQWFDAREVVPGVSGWYQYREGDGVVSRMYFDTRRQRWGRPGALGVQEVFSLRDPQVTEKWRGIVGSS